MKFLTFTISILFLASSLSCSHGKAHISSEEGGVVGLEINVPLSKETEYTLEQKKDLATKLGIIYIGETKEDVLKTLGYPQRKGKSIEGYDVWYYKYPRPVDVIFGDGKLIGWKDRK